MELKVLHIFVNNFSVYADNPWWNWKTVYLHNFTNCSDKIILDGIESLHFLAHKPPVYCLMIILDGIESLRLIHLVQLFLLQDNPWWNWKISTPSSSASTQTSDNPWWNWKSIKTKAWYEEITLPWDNPWWNWKITYLTSRMFTAFKIILDGIESARGC